MIITTNNNIERAKAEGGKHEGPEEKEHFWIKSKKHPEYWNVYENVNAVVRLLYEKYGIYLELSRDSLYRHWEYNGWTYGVGWYWNDKKNRNQHTLYKKQIQQDQDQQQQERQENESLESFNNNDDEANNNINAVLTEKDEKIDALTREIESIKAQRVKEREIARKALDAIWNILGDEKVEQGPS